MGRPLYAIGVWCTVHRVALSVALLNQALATDRVYLWSKEWLLAAGSHSGLRKFSALSRVGSFFCLGANTHTPHVPRSASEHSKVPSAFNGSPLFTLHTHPCPIMQHRDWTSTTYLRPFYFLLFLQGLWMDHAYRRGGQVLPCPP
jgi:hypothetical protein